MKKEYRITVALVVYSLFVSCAALWWVLTDVDEEQFCRDKIHKWFPDKKYEGIGMSLFSDVCVGIYSEVVGEQRDGLIYNGNIIYHRDTFRLTAREDIDYVNRDNVAGGVLLALISLPVLVVIFG